MSFKLYRELNQIKGGWRSRCATLGLAAHGHSPDVADRNLERTVRLFLTPFQRQGTLQEEAAALGLEVAAVEGDRNRDELAVVVVE